MFPTLSSLFEYFFGIQVPLPFKTFGFFFAGGFVASYFTFYCEFKRKEKLGQLPLVKREEVVGAKASILEIAMNAGLGFLFGFKIIGGIISYATVLSAPFDFLFSWGGNLYTGFLFAIVFSFWIWYDKRKKMLAELQVVTKVVHPYQCLGQMALFTTFWGMLGAKLFYCFEDIDRFLADPVAHLSFNGGFTYLGGFVFGMLSYFYFWAKRGMRNVFIADVGAIALITAYGVGRIGCALSGDGDWGIANVNPKPGWLKWLPDWAWSFRFPHNVLNQGIYIPGCTGSYCYQLEKGVYPTSLYEVAIYFCLFVFMWSIRKHVYAGIMASLFLISAGAERYFIEMIRVNHKYRFGKVYLTEAQLISIGMFIAGLIWFYKVLYVNLYRSKAKAAKNI